MYKMKKFATVALAVLIFTMFPVETFAAECQETEASKHTHNYVFQYNSYTYIPIDGTYHTRITIPFYTCSGCGLGWTGSETKVKEDHSMSSLRYTGYNYHSGSLHYVQYMSSCVQCKHAETKMDSYKCPGNGNCILPQSVIPVPVEK